MHISEGILSGPVLVAGALAAAAGTAAGLKDLDEERLPRTALLTAAFFVASLIHIPVGPTSVHLTLNGLLGLLLGWAAFPAILIALLLQAFLFQFGGLTTLGVNTVIMAAPAVICGMGTRPFLNRGPAARVAGAGACGALSILLAAFLAAGTLVLTGEEFLKIAGAFLAAYLPVMIMEAVITAACVVFLHKVRPEMLPSSQSPVSRTRSLSLLLLFLGAVALFLTPRPAAAHRVSVFAWVDGDTVRVESWFSGGRKVKNGEVQVVYGDGSPALIGRTDGDGLFSFPAPERQEVLITLTAGMGHRGEWTLRPEDFPPASAKAAAADTSVSAAGRAAADGDAPFSPEPGDPAKAIACGRFSPEDLARLGALLDQKLAPFHRALADSRRSEPKIREIIAGIGYIFGLAGVWLLASKRLGVRGNS